MPPTKIDLSGVVAAGRALDIEEHFSLPPGDVAFDGPVLARLHVRRVGSELEITGRISGAYTADCARCLESVRREFACDVEERIDPTSTDPFAEANVLADHHLDVADLARQAAEASLPIAILCDEACAGLCAACGESRTRQACRCVPRVMEVPWQT